MRASLMVLSSLRALPLSALSLEVWAKASQCNHYPGLGLCWGAGCVKARVQMHFPPVPGKVRIQKQMYLSLPTPQLHRAGHPASGWSVSLQWEQWQAANGNFTFNQGSCHSAVVLQAQHHPAESPASRPVLETQAPGKSQTLKSAASPCHSGPDTETH